MSNDPQLLKKRYEEFALSADYTTTASDFRLRELEIGTASEYIYDGCKVLDVGCGLGYAAIQYASRFKSEVHGLDYAGNMIKVGKELLAKNNPPLKGSVHLVEGSVAEIPYADNSFDVVTSSRCLMALLDWELQKKALTEIHRVLKPGGVLVLMEGTFDGLERLNDMRGKFGLEPIVITLKFEEKQLAEFCKPYFVHENTKRFGMYYFLTRVVQPLLVAPEKPSYSHKLNEIAELIAREYPDFEGLGHLVAFVYSKRR
ncbi:MAG: hypothetical protein FD123_3615 [Bacteroidetes bacterium]|nr:MAG: hypothetical protein FD123_3615 [Bacteroidota bacterium]